MWQGYEVAGLLLVAVLVGGILLIQRTCDPHLTVALLITATHPWAGFRCHLGRVAVLRRALPWAVWAGGVFLAGVAAWTAFRLARRAAQARQIVSLRLLLGRDDLAMPLTVSATLDAWAQVAENRYLPWLMGSDPVTLDVVRDAEGRLLLYLRGTQRTVESLAARLRATWTSVRTVAQPVPAVPAVFAAQVTPRYRRTTVRGFRTYRDYSHSITESVLAVLDEAEAPAHLQFVLSPRGPRASARAEREARRHEQGLVARGATDPSQGIVTVGEQAQLQAVAGTVGRQWWRAEIRIAAGGIATLQAIVGALNEAAAENAWVYHRVWERHARRAWDAWRRGGMPGVWPVVGCTSLPGVFLSTLWQIPSARLRATGLLREPTRRGPALLSIPTAQAADDARPRGVIPVVDEAGRRILLPEGDLQGNVLAAGSQGSGKSTILRRFVDFGARRADWATVVIDFKGSLADACRGIVPQGRPCAAWHVGQPDRFGYNPFIGGDPAEWDLTTDRILYAMKQAWSADAIMARSEDYLRHAVAATILLRHEAEGFRAVRQILSDPTAWQALGKKIPDRGVAAWFTQQAKMYAQDSRTIVSSLAAPANKLTALTFGARRAGATSGPVSLDLRRILHDRGVLIVNLAASELGDDNAALVGILLLSAIWNAIREERAPTLLVMDEAHRLLGESFFRLVAEGREYGARVALGLQFLGQIADERAMSTVRELVQNLFIFRSQNIAEAQEHSQLLSKIYSNLISPDQELQDILQFTPDDFVNLPNFRCIGRLLIGGSPQTAFLGETIRTEPSWAGVSWGTCPEGWLLGASPAGGTAVDGQAEDEPAPPEEASAAGADAGGGTDEEPSVAEDAAADTGAGEAPADAADAGGPAASASPALEPAAVEEPAPEAGPVPPEAVVDQGPSSPTDRGPAIRTSADGTLVIREVVRPEDRAVDEEAGAGAAPLQPRRGGGRRPRAYSGTTRGAADSPADRPGAAVTEADLARLRQRYGEAAVSVAQAKLAATPPGKVRSAVAFLTWAARAAAEAATDRETTLGNG